MYAGLTDCGVGCLMMAAGEGKPSERLKSSCSGGVGTVETVEDTAGQSLRASIAGILAKVNGEFCLNAATKKKYMSYFHVTLTKKENISYFCVTLI